jgi:endonuclease/exonuclease/phosphatase family metal-dependent hydrolase
MLKALHSARGLNLFLTLILVLPACTSLPRKQKPEGSLSVMSYNVENLFDTLPDSGREDFTFLPLSLKTADPRLQAGCKKAENDYRRQECLNTDWNEKVLDLKLKRLADTILEVDGRGPDILILQEVENLRVLKLLNDQYLTAAGYQTAQLLEGEDLRGIDIAVLSRLPLAGDVKLHPMEIRFGMEKPDWKRPLTRGILEVPLKLPNGETLTVMGFHFPSQAAPTGFRRDAIQFLNTLAKNKGAKALIIAGGDSNISQEEETQHHLQRDLMGSQWSVSHVVGCKDCMGTQNYRGTWNFFDVLLFSEPLTNGQGSYQLLTNSIQVQRQGRYQLRQDGTPARFNEKSNAGVSDHLPIYGEIAPRP